MGTRVIRCLRVWARSRALLYPLFLGGAIWSDSRGPETNEDFLQEELNGAGEMAPRLRALPALQSVLV